MGAHVINVQTSNFGIETPMVSSFLITSTCINSTHIFMWRISEPFHSIAQYNSGIGVLLLLFIHRENYQVSTCHF